ncbi:pyridoxal phosphate-dependent aminotransferase [Derxia gummosa]|uniref:Aminotransferase n=1 Tax=Derxia gummosa DSM 723 TaxID=1121388 RepID=A0A8B6X2I6_9BURK|nr:pyridoxal phosphate-dependent aminotransferase [Derxia gummosa]
MQQASPALAARLANIQPFHAMEIVKAADALERAGRDLVYLALGEPDFAAPEPVQRAALAAMQSGATRYTAALGLPELREAISGFYARHYALDVPPERIVVTAGASGALLLACLATLDPGSEVLMSDPGYPCNRHFVAAVDAVPRALPCGPEQRFQLDARQIATHWTARTRAALLASPSNPTGTSVLPAELAAIAREVRSRHGWLIVDEIYHALSYDLADPTTGWAPSALALGDDIITVNSFSKFFGMTGWRLGWLVLPPSVVRAVEKLAQNLFICASTLSQRAALACFGDDAMATFLARRDEFRRRRAFLLPALRDLGLDVPVTPDGAFYIYADVSRHAPDSDAFANRMLEEAGVVLVPGKDFGAAGTRDFVRFSYATGYERIELAVERMGRVLRG